MFNLLFCLLVIGGAVSTPVLKGLEDVRIVGGETVDITAVPYQVSVLYRGRHSCGGSIIDNDLVVTAAHCVMGSPASYFQVRAGSSSSDSGGQIYQVADLVWHPRFTYNKMDSDIALLWLATPMEFNEAVMPIPMFETNEEITDGDLTIVTGWGNIREGGGYPPSLQMVLVPKVSSDICSIAYGPIYSITTTMLCAGLPEGGKDACQGDSGGPLVHNGRLAGVVSWGLGCARPKYPGVYAKVSALREWIDYQTTFIRLKHVLRVM